RALQLIRGLNIRVVILSARWSNLRSRGLGQLQSTLSALHRLGVETYIIGQSPNFITDVETIAYQTGHATDRNAQWSIVKADGINRDLARSVASDVHFVDPIGAMCRHDLCPYLQDNRLLFSDDGHFSRFGSSIAVTKYFPLRRTPRPQIRS